MTVRRHWGCGGSWALCGGFRGAVGWPARAGGGAGNNPAPGSFMGGTPAASIDPAGLTRLSRHDRIGPRRPL